MKSRVERIDPQKAQAILDAHWVKDRQRNPSPSVVSSYARSMRAGQWLLTHQGIAIDDNSELIDGVHRLLAVIESGTPIDIMVTRDISHNGNNAGIYTIDAIDRGHERGVGQQLGLRHRLANANLVAAVCRGVLLLATSSRKLHVGKFNVANSLRVLDIYGREIRYCIENRSREPRIRNASVISASAFAIKAFSQVSEFYHQVTTGEDIKDGYPSLTFRRWMITNIDRSGTNIEYRALLTCAMKHVMKEQIKKVYDTEHGYNFFLEKQRNSVNKLLALCGYPD
jgi:hypothetical protein